MVLTILLFVVFLLLIDNSSVLDYSPMKAAVVLLCVDFTGVVQAFDKAWDLDKANCVNYFR